MQKSSITIDVLLDAEKTPENISWHASDSSAETSQKAKAMCVGFWDGEDKTAMRIDLWTKNMMVDEMGEFFYQLMFTMGDTFKRAVKNNDQGEDIKAFANEFIKKFRAAQLSENSA